MSESVHKERIKELDSTFLLDKHLAEICSRAYIQDKKFQNKNTLYMQPFPRQIRIAPPVSEMVRIMNGIRPEIEEIKQRYIDDEKKLFVEKKHLILSNLKPAKIITLEKPIENNLWWGDTLKAINLRPGLIDNDASKPFPGDITDKSPHGCFGGDTGEGKSVLMHAIIMSLLYEYAPWELRLWLNDAKANEFKKYAGAYRPPQIRVIGACQSPEYIASTYAEFDAEMRALYALVGEFDSVTLAGARNYLNMAIPANLVMTDEYSQVHALGSNRVVRSVEQSNQSIAKLGRQMKYHMIITSQVFKGTLDSGTLGQFGFGIAVGTDDSTSESIIGNSKAETLKGKIGYCLYNPIKKLKKDSMNVEYKVCFWPDDTDEQKIAYQGFLKPLHDLRHTLDIDELYPMEFFNEKTLKNYVNLDEDTDASIDYVLDQYPYVDRVMSVMCLGDIMKYSPNKPSVGSFNWEAVRRQNLFIHSTSLEDIKYMCYLVGDNLKEQVPNAKHVYVLDDMVMEGNYVDNATKDLTSDFKVDMYLNAAMSREVILKYNLACKGFGTEPTPHGFLTAAYSKLKDVNTLNFLEQPRVKDYLLSVTHEDLLEDLQVIVYGTDEEIPADTVYSDLREFNLVSDLAKKLTDYVKNMERREGMYLKSTDFTPTIFWLFEPRLNEGLMRHETPTDNFLKLLSMGPTVGIFFISVMTDITGCKGMLMASRHCISRKPQAKLEAFGRDAVVDEADVAYKYDLVEGELEDSFYFKKYFKSEM